MRTADATAFLERLVTLAEVFDVVMSPARQKLYFDALKDLSIEDVISALNAAAKACTFMPKPAELRKLALGDDEDQAEIAWLALRQTMTKAGAYASIATEDPALGEAIIALFGTWSAACALDLSPEMWSSKRKEFGRVFRVFRDRALAGTRYLPGICEQQNAGREAWLKYVQVAVIGSGGELKLLRGDHAETYCTAIAAGASRDLSRLTDGVKEIARPA